MALDDLEDQERREAATPKRREEALKKGQVVQSPDVTSSLLLLGGVAGLYLLGPSLSTWVYGDLAPMWAFSISDTLTQAGFYRLLTESIASVVFAVFPLAVGLCLVGILSSVLQHGMIWVPSLLAPDISRISPLRGFRRIFSAEAVASFVKTILKLMVVASAAYFVIRTEVARTIVTGGLYPSQVLPLLGAMILKLTLWMGVLVTVVGIADYGFQRWQYERRLRMTRQELKEESRETEGDPLMRMRIRSIRREMARRRMMAEVPKADVVITNPSELAIALRYRKEEMKAPKVIAKGAGFIAQKIREVATEHGIPLVENKPLARTIYQTVDLGGFIPSNLYRAMAEVLAYVYRLKGRVA